MTKICLIGAGSTVFARNILSDVLSNAELVNSDIALFDIDEVRLSTSTIMTKRIYQTLGIGEREFRNGTGEPAKYCFAPP